MYRIKFLPAAAKDRDDIREYLSQFYAGTAGKFFALLRARLNQLKSFPHSCQPYEDDPDYHVMVAGDYLVFYMADEQEKTIEVHRIFHESRNISQHLHKTNYTDLYGWRE